MSEPKEIAIAALKKMLAKVGPEAEFPGDAIWEYADEDVEPLRKPPVFKMLSSDGYIADTGEKTNAVTPERRSAPTTKYRFGNLLKPLPSEVTITHSMIAASFSLACKGVLRVQEGACIRICSALLSKRFLILTGLAGSGKTKLAQALAHWITPNQPGTVGSRPYFSVVPVGADWTGNESILGYPDGLQSTSYVSKPALDLVLHATAHEDIPHFLILDEMNLSHVERYFADILSILESDEGLILYSGDMLNSDSWRRTEAAKDVPPRLKKLPENLFIIGTVNVDETTYMFSPKVLDRANVIEFRMDAGELEGFLDNPTKPDLSKLDGKGSSFGKAFVLAAKQPAVVPDEVKAIFDAELLLFFKTLQGHDAEFGYRTAYESGRFIHFYKLLGNHSEDSTTWFSKGWDCLVLQKFLPKLHGSRAKLGPALKKLWFLCVTPHRVDTKTVEERDMLITNFLKAAGESKGEPLRHVPAEAPYPMSAEKIGRMWRLLIENGFASFAEA